MKSPTLCQQLNIRQETLSNLTRHTRHLVPWAPLMFAMVSRKGKADLHSTDHSEAGIYLDAGLNAFGAETIFYSYCVQLVSNKCWKGGKKTRRKGGEREKNDKQETFRKQLFISITLSQMVILLSNQPFHPFKSRIYLP